MRRSGDAVPQAGAGRAVTTKVRARGGRFSRQAGNISKKPEGSETFRTCRRIAALLPVAAVFAACTATQGVDATTTAAIPQHETTHFYSDGERNCMERAIFFEANRSSEEGLLAVGTVVMNRVEAQEFPDTVCAVVGQKNQFAPGVLSRSFPREKVPDVQQAAAKVLAGYRHPKLDASKFFHMAGLTFPYRNMHYRLEAGGNAFYERH